MTTSSVPRSPLTEQELVRRLLVEAAIAQGFSLRLEQHLGTRRTVTRIVRPVRIERSQVTDASDLLVTRTADAREIGTPLDEAGDISLVTTQLDAEEEQRGAWRVGDTVRDTEHGLGVIQSFPPDEPDMVVVRFDGPGASNFPLTRLEQR
jgi:hypothetical protein